MAITRHRDAVYWVHSAPAVQAVDDPQPNDVYDGEDCPGKHRVDRPEPGQPVWCRDHQAEIHTAIRVIPDLAANCLRLEDGQLLGQPEKVETKVVRIDPPSPSPAYDAVEAAARWVTETAQELAERLGEADPRQKRTNTEQWMPHLSRGCSYLSTRCTAWLSGDDAAQQGNELLKLEKRLRAQAGLDRLVHHLPDSCLQCGRNSLRRRDGKDFVECTNPACRARWPWEQFEFLAKAYAESEGATG